MGHLTPRLPFGALISRLLRAIVDPCDKLDEKISFLLIISLPLRPRGAVGRFCLPASSN